MSGDVERGLVDVVHGIFAHSLPLAGNSVGEARSQLTGILQIDPEAVSFIDGEQVDAAAVLTAGQVLNFVKRAGEMG